MKNYRLYLTIRVEAESALETLSETIAEFEGNTVYSLTNTENVAVSDTELLKTEIFHP